MNADELYTALSERITADAMRHETNKWPDYYNGLRDLIRRVVTESTETSLSTDEKDGLALGSRWLVLLSRLGA